MTSRRFDGDERTQWLPYNRSRIRPPTARLFCLPYAGGSATVFLPWSAVVPDWLEICPIQLPGREQRIMEPASRSIQSLARSILAVCRPLMDQPFAFFGHSMGGLLGYEITRMLLDGTEPHPVGLFVSGTRPPHRNSTAVPRHRLSDADLLDHVREIGGTPDAFFDSPALCDLLLPTIRADLEAAETYSHPSHPPLTVPISGFCGLRDELAGPSDMEEWRQYTSASFAMRKYDDGHFFIRDRQDSMLGAVIEDLGGWDTVESAELSR